MSAIKAAIDWFEDTIKESDEIYPSCSRALQVELDIQKGHFETVLSILREKMAEPHQLALDELRQMDGQPVYIVELCDVPYNRWEILDRECPVDMEAQDVNLEGGDCYATYTLGKTWAAYDHPPGGEGQ